jgi:hypothetical protein
MVAAVALMRLISRIVGALTLIGAVAVPALGYGWDTGSKLAFIGVFLLVFLPMHLQPKASPSVTPIASGAEAGAPMAAVGPSQARAMLERYGRGPWWKIVWVLLLILSAYWFRSTSPRHRHPQSAPGKAADENDRRDVQ